MQVKRGRGTVMAPRTTAREKASAARKRLPGSDYVFDGRLPPSKRRYPIPDAEHAGRALQGLLRTAGRHGVTEGRRKDALKVMKTVKSRFPGVYKGESDIVKQVKRTYGIVDK